jgi:AraC-like DNA-binding protein
VADTVLSVASRAILDAYERLGLDGEALLKAAGLTRDEVLDPDRRLPAAHADALFAAAYARADDPDLALHAAEALPFGAYRVVDFLCAYSATVAEAYRRIAAYFALVDVRARLEVRDSPPCLVMRAATGQPIPQPAQEYTFAALIRRMAVCIGEDFRPTAVELAFDAPPDASEHQRVLGAPVRFGAPEPRILFDEATFHAPIPDANPALASVLEDHARRLCDELPPGDDLPSRVRAAVAEEPDSGAATVKSVAKRLAMSERTLSRRLKELDLTFGQLKAESRFGLARTHLRDPSLSIAEVGWLLGFADQSAFTRAFRRWSGKPPGEFRREGR